jgi:3-deoxy-D-manno-octulosonate 8-phosphate phosphatase (KDO 8-P phosphatase)
MFKQDKKTVQWSSIELVIFDCDGVLTDGRIIYSGEVLEAKNFSAHDGMGFALLHKAGLTSAVITGRTSKVLTRRCEDLHIQYVLQGIKNKLEAAQKLLAELDLQWHQVVYMGDDWNDIPVMQKAAFSVCPADAIPEIIQLADFTTDHFGGDGAARDCIDHILRSKGLYEKAVSMFLKDITEIE